MLSRPEIRFPKLEQRWNAENYKSYLNRPDIQRLKNNWINSLVPRKHGTSLLLSSN